MCQKKDIILETNQNFLKIKEFKDGQRDLRQTGDKYKRDPRETGDRPETDINPRETCERFERDKREAREREMKIDRTCAGQTVILPRVLPLLILC